MGSNCGVKFRSTIPNGHNMGYNAYKEGLYMKKLPKKIPPRYFKEYREKEKEWRFRKKIRFINAEGKKVETTTKWHWTIDECEAEAKKIIEEGQYVEKDNRKKTLFEVYEEYLQELDELAHRQSDIKISSDRNNYDNALGLRGYFDPAIKNKAIREIKTEDWSQWIDYINSPVKGHRNLSGITVKKYKGVVKKFNRYLQLKGFISAEQAILNENAIMFVKTKRSSVGRRNDRNYPVFEDIRAIMKFYKGNDGEKIGAFKNLYWYTFWTVLYFTGMRIGEFIALQWKNIDFNGGDYGTGVIYVVNAINHKETRENVMRRIKANNLALKNENSEREITIWAYYRQILIDYKYAYRYEFDVMEEEMDNMFVFPNINARDSKEKSGYQRQSNALRELDRLTEKLGINKLDCQMFRHGCAHFLCDVKHISAEEAHDYFGHQDSEMIREVYAKANQRQKRKRVDRALKELITENPDFEIQEEEIDISDSEELRASQKESSYQRELAQIRNAIKKRKRIYYYDLSHAELVIQAVQEHPEFKDKIKFTLE